MTAAASLRVRIVDDVEDIGVYVKSLLEHDSDRTFEVSVSTSFTDTDWDDVDVAVVDMMSADGEASGVDVLALLVERHPAIRRVIFSAHGHLAPEVTALAHVTVVKPGRSGELLAAVCGGP